MLFTFLIDYCPFADGKIRFSLLSTLVEISVLLPPPLTMSSVAPPPKCPKVENIFAFMHSPKKWRKNVRHVTRKKLGSTATQKIRRHAAVHHGKPAVKWAWPGHSFLLCQKKGPMASPPLLCSRTRGPRSPRRGVSPPGYRLGSTFMFDLFLLTAL